jgi:hypothetical protein
MVQSEVTSQMQVFVLARLFRISVIQGEGATPTQTKGSSF